MTDFVVVEGDAVMTRAAGRVTLVDAVVGRVDDRPTSCLQTAVDGRDATFTICQSRRKSPLNRTYMFLVQCI